MSYTVAVGVPIKRNGLNAPEMEFQPRPDRWGRHLSNIDAKRALVEGLDQECIGLSDTLIKLHARQWLNNWKTYKIVKIS